MYIFPWNGYNNDIMKWLFGGKEIWLQYIITNMETKEVS